MWLGGVGRLVLVPSSDPIKNASAETTGVVIVVVVVFGI